MSRKLTQEDIETLKDITQSQYRSLYTLIEAAIEKLAVEVLSANSEQGSELGRDRIVYEKFRYDGATTLYTRLRKDLETIKGSTGK